MKIDPYKIDQYFTELENRKIFDLREPLYKLLGDDLTKWPAPWVFFWTGYLSVEKEVLLAVGKFDNNYQTWGYEDIDLGLALYTNNVKIILNRKLRSLHYPHEKIKSTFNAEELKMHILNKRQYIHSKYKLQATEIFVSIGGWELNQKLLALRNN